MTGVFFELGDVLGLTRPFHRWMTAAEIEVRDLEYRLAKPAAISPLYPPKADIARRRVHVRLVPKAGIVEH
jgi:hypothetical protein